jgi:hypothetical protein
MRFLLAFCLITLLVESSLGQDHKIADYNSNAWYQYFGNYQLYQKWGLYTDVQARRTSIQLANPFADPQQFMIRSALTHQISKPFQLAIGYAHVPSFPYGDYPQEKTSKENRIFQQILFKKELGKFRLEQRVRLEQRFIGKGDEREYKNRVRYQIQLEAPLLKKSLDEKGLYLSIYDEPFIGFGGSVGSNIFDQNRVGAAIGYAFAKQFKVELGYMNQLVAHSKKQIEKETGKLGKVYEVNHTLLIALRVNLKRESEDSQ